MKKRSCKFFYSPSGCSKGNRCRFSHQRRNQSKRRVGGSQPNLFYIPKTAQKNLKSTETFRSMESVHLGCSNEKWSVDGVVDRLKKEFRECELNPIPGICARPTSNYQNWHGNILMSSRGFPFDVMIIHFILTFSDDYPFAAPTFKSDSDNFVPKFWINCWKENMTVHSLLSQIRKSYDAYSSPRSWKSHYENYGTCEECSHDWKKRKPFPIDSLMQGMINLRKLNTEFEEKQEKLLKDELERLVLQNYNFVSKDRKQRKERNWSSHPYRHIFKNRKKKNSRSINLSKNPFWFGGEDDIEIKKKKDEEEEGEGEIIEEKTNFMDLPIDVIEHGIFPFFIQSMLKPISQVNKVLQDLVFRYFKIMKNHLECSISKKNIDDDGVILGYEIYIVRNKKTQEIMFLHIMNSSRMISYRTYKNDLFNWKYEFLPSYINHKHGKDSMNLFKYRFINFRTKNNSFDSSFFNPMKGIEFLVRVMISSISRIMEKSKKKNDIKKSLTCYFECLRMCVSLIHEFPYLKKQIDFIIKRFLSSDETERKMNFRDMFILMQLLIFSSKYSWKDVVIEILSTQFIRCVKWVVVGWPEYELDEDDLLKPFRRKLMFWNSFLFCAQFMMISYSLYNIIHPIEEEEEEEEEEGEEILYKSTQFNNLRNLCKNLEDMNGLIPFYILNQFQQNLIYLQKVNNLEHFFKVIGVQPIGPLNTILKECLVDSLDLKYHERISLRRFNKSNKFKTEKERTIIGIRKKLLRESRQASWHNAKDSSKILSIRDTSPQLFHSAYQTAAFKKAKGKINGNPSLYYVITKYLSSVRSDGPSFGVLDWNILKFISRKKYGNKKRKRFRVL